ncbi:MAG: dihydrofolate reductase [Novosphingobium sp.]|nr:dihydrofolate reductase [Novosphingobium sp.]
MTGKTPVPGLFLVVARASNGTIGINGGLPWKIPADMRRFRQLTLDKTVIMGRKTFASLPGTLPRRRHVVITRDAEWTADGVDVAQDEDAALWIANAGNAEVAVIGGAEIYALFEPLATRIELTEVHAPIPGDTTMPAFDPARWREVRRDPQEPLEGEPPYDFVTLDRVT